MMVSVFRMMARMLLAFLLGTAIAAAPPLQLIDGSGSFAAENATASRCPERTLDYAVVSVVGPQSSGKSTLLNTVFGADFGVLDDSFGRHQTTLGVWVQEAPVCPGLILLDIQGSDSIESGEKGRCFERQTALLALALSDTLVINLWEHDIGRLEASNLALLSSVFELTLELRRAAGAAVAAGRRQTLLFVVRDKASGTAEEILEAQLAAQLAGVWEDVWQPGSHGQSDATSAAVDADAMAVSKAASKAAAGPEPQLTLADLFNVRVVFLPHKRLQTNEWMAAAAALRVRTELWHAPVDDGLAEDGPAPSGSTPLAFAGVPAEGFFTYARHVWAQIESAAPLHLPSLRTLLAEHRCAALADAETDRACARVHTLRRQLRRQLGHATAAVAHGSSAEVAAAELARTGRTFRRRCERVLQQGLRAYDDASARYVPLAAGSVVKHRQALAQQQVPHPTKCPVAASCLARLATPCLPSCLVPCVPCNWPGRFLSLLLLRGPANAQ